MKDIEIYVGDFGYFSLQDSIKDIKNKLKDNREVKIEVNDKLVTVRDVKNKDNDTNALMAFVLDEKHKRIQMIDTCLCEAKKIRVGDKTYSFSEFKQKYGTKDGAYAHCDKLDKIINPCRVNKECDSICSKNNFSCYLNCTFCRDVKQRIEFKRLNTVVEYWEGSDDTMVSVERQSDNQMT